MPQYVVKSQKGIQENSQSRCSNKNISENYFSAGIELAICFSCETDNYICLEVSNPIKSVVHSKFIITAHVQFMPCCFIFFSSSAFEAVKSKFSHMNLLKGINLCWKIWCWPLGRRSTVELSSSVELFGVYFTSVFVSTPLPHYLTSLSKKKSLQMASPPLAQCLASRSAEGCDVSDGGSSN